LRNLTSDEQQKAIAGLVHWLNEFCDRREADPG
jgi:hypothetical protein